MACLLAGEYTFYCCAFWHVTIVVYFSNGMQSSLLIPSGGGQYSVKLLTAPCHLFSPGSHLDHDIIIVSHLVHDGPDHPTQHEDANDHAPEKAAVQVAEIIPDASREIQRAADNR